MQTQFVNTAQVQILEAQAQTAKANVAGASGKANQEELRKTAEDFEAVFLSQMLQPMFNTIPTESFMGGGQAESIYRDMMVQEMGKSIAKNGGVGIADTVFREMLKMQEG